MNVCARGRASGGFTLIELLFVVALVAVLAAIATPVYLNYVTKVRLAGHAQFVLETLRLARIEAVTRRITRQRVRQHQSQRLRDRLSRANRTRRAR